MVCQQSQFLVYYYLSDACKYAKEQTNMTFFFTVTAVVERMDTSEYITLINSILTLNLSLEKMRKQHSEISVKKADYILDRS